MTQNLKIEVLTGDISIDGMVVTNLVTKEELSTAIVKKADLGTDGKIPTNQLPDNILNTAGIVDTVKLQLETSIKDAVDESNAYAESYTDNAVSSKADLVTGKVPLEQLPAIDQYPQFGTALSNLSTSILTAMKQRTDELEKTKAALGEDGKVLREQIPSYEKISGLPEQLEVMSTQTAAVSGELDQHKLQTADQIDVLKENIEANVQQLTDRQSHLMRNYATKELGVDANVGVKPGEYFYVRSDNEEEVMVEYQNVGGSAVATGKSYLSALGVAVQAKEANTIVDSSGRTQQAINNDFINVKTYGAIGDNTLHTVQEWTVIGSRIYYPNLAAIQVDYPHVTSLSDSIDWAAIQKALDTGRDVVGPPAHYHINKSLYIKKTHQQFKDLGFIRMDAGLAKPVLYLGAKDTNGTKSDGQVWFSEISGTSFHGFGNRSEGSAGLSLVSCSQCKISVDARGFHAGIRVDGVCVINTFFQPILLQNTYGLYDPLGHPTISDIQASAFFGGRIEQNEKEGVYSASPNIKFIGTVIEGNGKFNGSDGSTPEVTLLRGPTSGAVTFADCYMESLAGKSSQSVIAISPNASRFVFVTGGEYFGSVDNNKYVVDILSPASVECGVFITQAFVSNFINYVRGTISGNSRVSVINNFPKADMSIFSSVNVGIGSPLIQQIDRTYQRTNQNVRARSFSSDSSIETITLTASDMVTANYFLSKNPVIGLTLYNHKFTKRNRTPSAAVTSYTCIPLSDIDGAAVYMFKIMAVQRMASNAGRAFEANLFVTGNGGSPTIQNSQILWNTDSNLIPTFSVDSTGVVVSNLSTAGLYDFEVTRFGRS